MASTVDEGRLQEVLRFVRVPKTAEEVAEHLNCHLQTARQCLWALRDRGYVTDGGPRGPEKQKTWQAKSGHRDTGDEILTSAGTVALRDIAFSWNTPSTAYLNMIGGCLAYLWRRAYYSQQDQSQIKNVAKQGTLDPTLEVRIIMESVFEKMSVLHETLEYMLTNMDWLWSDDPQVLKMLGPVNRAELEDAAEWFEEWAKERL